MRVFLHVWVNAGMCLQSRAVVPVHTTVMLGRRSSPTVCRYGDFDTLGEHREAQYSARLRKKDERQFAGSTR